MIKCVLGELCDKRKYLDVMFFFLVRHRMFVDIWIIKYVWLLLIIRFGEAIFDTLVLFSCQVQFMLSWISIFVFISLMQRICFQLSCLFFLTRILPGESMGALLIYIITVIHEKTSVILMSAVKKNFHMRKFFAAT